MFAGMKTVVLTEQFDPNAKTERPAWQPLSLREEDVLLDAIFAPKNNDIAEL